MSLLIVLGDREHFQQPLKACGNANVVSLERDDCTRKQAGVPRGGGLISRDCNLAL